MENNLYASVMWQPVLLKFIQIFIHKIITLFKKQLLSEKLQIPKAKTEFFKKTFTYSGPKQWNELPFSTRQASHNTFKTNIKSLILNDDVP